MSAPERRRGLTAVAVLAVAATGVVWSGCGDSAEDEAQEAVDNAQEQVEQATDDAEQAIEDAGGNAEEIQDAVEEASSVA